jgi:hypothetical protein
VNRVTVRAHASPRQKRYFRLCTFLELMMSRRDGFRVARFNK